MPEPLDLDALDAFLAEPRNAIVAGIRADGRLHLTPNWFLWDGERFFVSTTKDRVKYRLFGDNPRAQLVVDDVHGFRYVIVDATVTIDEGIDSGLPYFRDLRHKHGRTALGEAELRAEMVRDERVTLIFTPDGPPTGWLTKGF